MIFNINEYVRVKLTATGKEILRKQHEEFISSVAGSVPDSMREFRLPQEDSEGWSKWQMWSLMNTFGSHIYLSADPPFETEIEILKGSEAA